MAGGRSQRHMVEVLGKASNGSTTGSFYAPRVNAVPTVSGTAQVGQTLTGTNATLLSYGPTATITRAWLRGTAKTVISGATGATYVPVEADIGNVIRFRNTIVSDMGTTVSESNPTAAVIAA